MSQLGGYLFIYLSQFFSNSLSLLKNIFKYRTRQDNKPSPEDDEDDEEDEEVGKKNYTIDKKLE